MHRRLLKSSEDPLQTTPNVPEVSFPAMAIVEPVVERRFACGRDFELYNVSTAIPFRMDSAGGRRIKVRQRSASSHAVNNDCGSSNHSRSAWYPTPLPVPVRPQN